MRTTEGLIFEYHQYIIIGAGIAGIQAGIILGQNNQDFIILEATNKIGGRIGTDKLCDVLKQEIKDQNQYPKWLLPGSPALNTSIEYGATWISQQHSYMLKILKQFKIRTFPQYYDGLSIYGREPNKFEQVRQLSEHYKNYELQIKQLITKIDSLKTQFCELKQMAKYNQQSQYKLNKFIDTYDTIFVKDFITNQLQNCQLVNQILNQMETLECISGDKISLMQLFDDDSSLQNIKYYTGKIQNTMDGVRVQNGMITVINQMKNKMMRQTRIFKPTITQSDILIMNSPVIKIDNIQGKDIKIYVKSARKVYQCKHILFSVPIAVINQIQITGMSPSKKLIYENQQNGSIHRVYLVFQHAFWRYKYTGYGSFNQHFPFNQLAELSPSNLACGVLAFMFFGEKYRKWLAQTPESKDRVNYLKNVVAQMFLRGDTSSPYLQSCFSYTRSYSEHPYIQAGYQATTKASIWKKVKDSGDDYFDSYSRDENNLFYIGSQFGNDYDTYMQGAIRLSREKTYSLLGMKDPWQN